MEQLGLDQLHLLRQFDHPRRRRADAQVIRPDRHGLAEEVGSQRSEKKRSDSLRLTSDL
jgi:hypothetical protein